MTDRKLGSNAGLILFGFLCDENCVKGLKEVLTVGKKSPSDQQFSSIKNYDEGVKNKMQP